jgi:hypothetical protein
MLPDQDSNLNYQSQNLKYYHYTIGQLKDAGKNTRSFYYYKAIIF